MVASYIIQSEEHVTNYFHDKKAISIIDFHLPQGSHTDLMYSSQTNALSFFIYHSLKEMSDG